ncbi:hypothetical protein JCM6882_000943 [Rhodosporidiobolus microsporus]
MSGHSRPVDPFSHPLDAGMVRQGASTGFASSSSHSQHLRQRSTGSPRFGVFASSSMPPQDSRNPFEDAYAPPPGARRSPPLVAMPLLPEPTPHHAALMQHGTEESADPVVGVAKDQAMLMRNDKAEWTPTQQYLYSSASLGASSTAGAPLPGMRISPASSVHSSPNPGSSASRFDISPDDFLFVSNTYPEADDDFHDPGEKLKAVGVDHRLVEPRSFRGGGMLSWQGFLNISAVIILMLALVFVFAGLPVWQWVVSLEAQTFGAAGLGGVNGSGQVPDIPAFRGLIDKDTPDSALTKKGFLNGKDYQLVFSDEFNEEGRLFYPGMDPYFQAVDLHYWQTNNIEYYDPGQVYTEDGHLVLELTHETTPNERGFEYLGGMLQSWNQFCYVGGYIEVAISLPGSTTVSGLWPAAWMMSNLGRAGHGGSLDGTWPYVYDTCDVGTLPNQTDPTTGLPDLDPSKGDQYANGDLSHLKGQRFSRCTCPEETDHPGPQYKNGTWKGRGASELDIFEATVLASQGIGEISQSAQWAPFNPSYAIDNSSTDYVDYTTNDFLTEANVYLGGTTQQVTSGLSHTDADTYNSTTNFALYGLEHIPSERDGWGNGKVLWTQADQEMWQISDQAMHANEEAGIGNRVVTAEPMYIILNLGLSENFGVVDLENLEFPSKMRVDYVRVYQDPDHIGIGCDPEDNPTLDYINRHPELYNNPNITVVADAGMTYPKNRLVDTCTS